MEQEPSLPSLRPYLLRAFYEWCCDNNFTPQIVVAVQSEDTDIQVPREYVQNEQIVLNISPEATVGLVINAEEVSFEARFGGKARRIWVPIGNVTAIFARENGAGMPFEIERPPRQEEKDTTPSPGFTRVE